MHVVHVIDGLSNSAGGTSRAVCDLTSYLSEIENCQCSILTKPSQPPEVECNSAIEINRLPSVPLWQLRGKVHQKLLEIHQRQPIDIVHTNGMWSLFLHFATSFARKAGIAHVGTPHGMLEPWSLKQKWLKKKVAWWLYQKNDLKLANAVQVTAKEEAKSVVDLGVKNFIMVPNGISIPRFDSAISKDNSVLFLSRIHPKKGIELLVRAWQKIAPQDWHLKIVGPGSEAYLSDLNKLIIDLGVSDSVTIFPPANDLEKWDYYRQASLFVLPTHSENFGIVIAEALAAKVPVLTTTGTPWSELDQKNIGWCIELSEANLAATLAKALSMTEQQRAEMGRLGHDYVDEHFSWTKIASNLFMQYQKIIANHPS